MINDGDIARIFGLGHFFPFTALKDTVCSQLRIPLASCFFIGLGAQACVKGLTSVLEGLKTLSPVLAVLLSVGGNNILQHFPKQVFELIPKVNFGLIEMVCNV